MNLDRELPQIKIVTSYQQPDLDHILVVPVAQGDAQDSALQVVGPGADVVGKQINLELLGASPKLGSLARTVLPQSPTTVVFFVGVESASPTQDQLRQAAASAIRAGVTLGCPMSFLFPTGSVDLLRGVVEGVLLGSYRFDHYRSDKKPVESLTVNIVTGAKAQTDELAALVSTLNIVATQVWRVRDLVNLAPNDLTPAVFAQYAAQIAKLPRTKVTVLDEKALEQQGFGGHIAVGKGSVNPPRLVKIAYRPPRAKKHVALVGKGITFDSGGLSLKPAGSMETMKCDMAGAATALGAVVAAAQLKSTVAVTAWLCLAENLPSGHATRPSDVISIYGGKTVEVLNTDAEGRLVLADGLSAAVAEDPDLVVDVATLTGAQMVALGAQVGAVMGSEPAVELVQQSATHTGEQMWPMPLPEYLRGGLDSKIADISNMGERFGGMLTAGIFLQEFVGDHQWAHLDIAGPAFNEGQAHGITPEGGTGFGLRTLLRLIDVVHR